MKKELTEPRAWFTVDELNAWADKKLKENPQWAEKPAQQQEPVATVTSESGKDGKEVIEWKRVDLTYHGDGNVGIGTPPQVKWDASAPLTISEPVERIRFIMSNQEPTAYVFAHSTVKWARVDKDLNVTHLDMELCAKGPQTVYTALAMAIWNKAIEEAANYAASEGNDVLADSIGELKI